ncbi:MAG: DUF1638 domain-containing protein [Deltaproteobacteria bacterium]|jgi:hypothetical protein|nr:DUF1638 domain-containing protein [Deltaproteobacteria bacterium]
MGNKKVVLLSCAVMRDLVGPHLDEASVETIYMDFGLHETPKRMAPALQQKLDAIEEPSVVLVGYGLCGTGIVGLEAGRHTLVIPRTHDCIAILLGSHQEYMKTIGENPGTYYLTKGWLESGSDPLREYESYVERYGQQTADTVMDTMYQNYTRICLVSHSEEDLAANRERALEVAAFCKERWGMEYIERVGSDALIAKLMNAPRDLDLLGDEFVVIPPGGKVDMNQFFDFVTRDADS